MLLTEQAGPVLTLAINDPERRNPLTNDVVEGLTEAIGSAGDSVRVIVVTGTGEQAFCAGGDLAGGFFENPIETHRQRGSLAELFRSMRLASQPIVARVNGHALAGGFGLMLACDMAVAADDATFGMPEINVGLWPMMISALVHQTLPQKLAFDLMMSGRRMTASEALAAGAVSRVVPGTDLDTTVDELVASLLEKSPAILALGKASFYSTVDMGFDAALDALAGGLTAVALTEDAKEGTRAFVEKRPANFTGR